MKGTITYEKEPEKLTGNKSGYAHMKYFAKNGKSSASDKISLHKEDENQH